MAGTTRRQAIAEGALLALARFTPAHADEHCEIAELIRRGNSAGTAEERCPAAAPSPSAERLGPVLAAIVRCLLRPCRADHVILHEAIRRQAAMLRLSLARMVQR